MAVVQGEEIFMGVILQVVSYVACLPLALILTHAIHAVWVHGYAAFVDAMTSDEFSDYV